MTCIIQTTDSYDYDNLGNLTSRSGLAGALQYDGTTGGGVHALSAAGDTQYHYDAYGNLSSRVSATSGTDSLAYDAFNKPTQIGNSYFSYGPDHARYKQASGGKTTYYLDGGSYEVVITATGTVENSYVGDYLLHSKAANDTTYTYLHRDNLGSVDAMTDASGNVIQRMSFNAWGERRPPAWGQGEVDASQFATTRGFTGHEMLDDTKLVHMNGRIYDPVVGRMLSADLYVQSPYNSQSYNRYSYVFNNPLSVVDPSGYLTADDMMYASMESRAQGVAWSASMEATVDNIDRTQAKMHAQQFVKKVRELSDKDEDEPIKITIISLPEKQANVVKEAIASKGSGTSINSAPKGVSYTLKERPACDDSDRVVTDGKGG